MKQIEMTDFTMNYLARKVSQFFERGSKNDNVFQFNVKISNDIKNIKPYVINKSKNNLEWKSMTINSNNKLSIIFVDLDNCKQKIFNIKEKDTVSFNGNSLIIQSTIEDNNTKCVFKMFDSISRDRLKMIRGMRNE